MCLLRQCWCCGKFATLIAPEIESGHYPCPQCDNGMLYVEETPATPLTLDPFVIACIFGDPPETGDLVELQKMRPVRV